MDYEHDQTGQKGLADYQPQVPNLKVPVLVNKAILEYVHVHSFTYCHVCGFLHGTTAELSSCERDGVAQEA